MDRGQAAKNLTAMECIRFIIGYRAVRLSRTSERYRLSPDERWIVSSSFDGTLLWNLRTGTSIRCDDRPSNCVACSPTGRYFVTGGGWHDELTSPWCDAYVHLWNLNTTKELYRLKGHESKIFRPSRSPLMVAASHPAATLAN